MPRRPGARSRGGHRHRAAWAADRRQVEELMVRWRHNVPARGSVSRGAWAEPRSRPGSVSPRTRPAPRRCRTLGGRPRSWCRSAPSPQGASRSTPRADRFCTASTRRSRFRPSRSSFRTTSTSPLRRTRRQRSRPAESSRTPGARSSWMSTSPTPAVSRTSRCGSSDCGPSAFETRAQVEMAPSSPCPRHSARAQRGAHRARRPHHELLAGHRDRHRGRRSGRRL